VDADFEVVGEITQVEVIAAQKGIRDLRRIRKAHGRGRWRKLKGFALVKLADGDTVQAELHWYEAHGVGRREMKIKRLLE
jgi:hypothetical protein